MPAAKSSDSDLFALVDKIKRSGALGRSPQYSKLLDYLGKMTADGSVCSEMTVGIEVFGKGDDFDVTTDSTVRVYMYNLRSKLKTYYETTGRHDEVQLSIPKGDYRLVATRPATNSFSSTVGNHLGPVSSLLMAAAISAVLAFVVTYLVMSSGSNPQQTYSEEQMRFWGGILSEDKPIMIVIGDYYIFGETSEDGRIRLVREFDINSAEDLSRAVGENEFDNRFDLALTYLPRGSAFALEKVHAFLQQSGIEPRISMMSEFSAEDLRENNIIYLGYVSGLSVLEDYVFASSRFSVGESYDVLIDDKTGNAYVSSVIHTEEDTTFVDYGLISSFTVADTSQVVIIAGTRDAGMMEMSELAAESDILGRLQLKDSEQTTFQGVFEVNGFDLTNVNANLIASE